MKRSWLSRVWGYFLMVTIVALIVLLSPIWIPIVLVVAAKEAITRRRVIRQNEGLCFFYYSSRRGWNEFVLNNVLPVLPATVVAVQVRGRGRDRYDRRRHVLGGCLWKLFNTVRHPYLLAVRAHRVRGVALHERLLPMKAHARRVRKLLKP